MSDLFTSAASLQGPTRTVACECCGTSTFSPDAAPRICRVCADELAAQDRAGLEPAAGERVQQLGMFTSELAVDGGSQTSMGF